MSNEIIKADDARIAKLDEAAKKAAVISNKHAGDSFAEAISKANALVVFRKLITDEILEAAVLPLMGTKIGFKTDRDLSKDGRYGNGIVKDCVIEAAMHGVPLTGNRFNILGGNFYLTREGVTYKLDNFRGLEYEIKPGTPTDVKPTEYVRRPDGSTFTKPGEATVSVGVDWKLDGKSDSRFLTFVVKMNKGMSTEAVQGKAWTRAAKWLWNKVSGYDVGVTDGEGTEIDAEVVKPAVAASAPVKALPKPAEAKTESDKVLDAIRRKQPAANGATPHKPEEREPPEEITHIDDDIAACM